MNPLKFFNWAPKSTRKIIFVALIIILYVPAAGT